MNDAEALQKPLNVHTDGMNLAQLFETSIFPKWLHKIKEKCVDKWLGGKGPKSRTLAA